MTLKEKVFETIRDDVSETKAAKFFDNGITWLIFLNVVAIIAQSYAHIDTKYHDQFHWFETFSVGIFSIEYVLRLWTVKLRHPEIASGWKAARKFTCSWMGIIDLFALLPFYLPFIFTFELRFLRTLRLFRLLRLFKLHRHSKAFQIVRAVFLDAKANLTVTIFLSFILMVIAATLVFHLEHEAQPDTFTDIGQAFWWAIATLTTVGYGDIYPITGLGKLFSGIIALLGIGMVALPTVVISSSFMEHIEKLKKAKGESDLLILNNRMSVIEEKIDLLLENKNLKEVYNAQQQEIENLRQQLNKLQNM